MFQVLPGRQTIQTRINVGSQGHRFLFAGVISSPILRAPVCKNQTNFKFRGKGGKFDFFHILMSDRLGYN